MARKNIQLTGLTIVELKKQGEMIEAGKVIEPRCYLCKRERNDTSVALGEGDGEFIFEPIQLWEAVLDIGETQTILNLCTECYVILQHVGQLADTEGGPSFEISGYSSKN